MRPRARWHTPAQRRNSPPAKKIQLAAFSQRVAGAGLEPTSTARRSAPDNPFTPEAPSSGTNLDLLGMSGSSFPERWPAADERAVGGYRLDTDGAFVSAPAEVGTVPAALGLWATAAA